VTQFKSFCPYIVVTLRFVIFNTVDLVVKEALTLIHFVEHMDPILKDMPPSNVPVVVWAFLAVALVEAMIRKKRSF